MNKQTDELLKQAFKSLPSKHPDEQLNANIMKAIHQAMQHRQLRDRLTIVTLIGVSLILLFATVITFCALDIIDPILLDADFFWLKTLFHYSNSLLFILLLGFVILILILLKEFVFKPKASSIAP